MAAKSITAAVILADISGSTPLYKTEGDAAAQQAIVKELRRLRSTIEDHGGVCIREKGDDVLGYFEDPGRAIQALRTMITRSSSSLLSVHVGLHYGPFLLVEDDIFGETVNVTARLSTLANAEEALLSRAVVEQLSAIDAASLLPIDKIWLKGVSQPLDIYSFTGDDTAMRTAMLPTSGVADAGFSGPAAGPGVTLVLVVDERVRRCRESDSLTLGRSEACDIVLPKPWISRRHASVSVRGGKVTIEDRSSSGTYVAMSGGAEILLRRETLVLTGDGTISPALPSKRSEACPIHFEVARR